ncbi:reverse transcriptase family protein [Bradyrhizobium ottawaense]|uniref:reverse transcriptase family protein n=1 Tax=Bradyrhizobium ottawaense TaxID=931866 RepID=UPI003FA10F17
MTRKKARRDLEPEQCWLYAISSPADLAHRLSIPRHKLKASDLSPLARDAGNYRLFQIEDGNGKSRAIQWPKRRLQTLHARVHTLLSRVAVPAYLYSAVRGKSYVDNASAHNPLVPTIKIDVKKFFPSVSRAVIFDFFFQRMRCRRDVAGLLADILTFDAHLPTGGAASPIIAYYSFKPMFDEIHKFALSQGLIMTCYVDDLTLSGVRASKNTLHEIGKIISRSGLKSHKARAFAASQPKVITGVCNTKSGRRVPNKLHLKIKKGFDDLTAAKTPLEINRIAQPLLGRLRAAGQIDPKFRARADTVSANIAASSVQTKTSP